MEYDYTPDICGAVLYTAFFLLCAARTRPFVVERVSFTSTDRIKLAFHLSLLASSLLEIVHYTIAIGFRGSVLSGYACHLVALWLSLVAFSLVIVLWSNTLNLPRRTAIRPTEPGAEEIRGICCGKARVSAAATFVCTIDAIVAISTVAVLSTGSVPAYSRPYLILMVTHSRTWMKVGLVYNFARNIHMVVMSGFIVPISFSYTIVTLFLLASWLVLYGIRLQRRVMGHPRWEPLDRRQRLKILCRINGVLVVCAACFLLRVAVLSSALFVRSRHRAEEMNRLLFEFLARWVSGLIPGVALLHIMCKTKKPSDDRPPTGRLRPNATNEEEQLREPLLPTRGITGSRSGSKGGMIDMSLNTQDWPEPSGDGRNAGAGDGRSSGATDSFVYHVIRSRQERTETTI